MSADEPRWTAGQPSLSEPRRDTGGRTEEEEEEEVKEDGDGGGRGRKRQEEEAKENGDGGGRGRWRQEALRLKKKKMEMSRSKFTSGGKRRRGEWKKDTAGKTKRPTR